MRFAELHSDPSARRPQSLHFVVAYACIDKIKAQAPTPDRDLFGGVSLLPIEYYVEVCPWRCSADHVTDIANYDALAEHVRRLTT